MEKYQGDIYAILTAVTWSVAVIFFKLSGNHLPAIPLKVFQNTLSVILFACTILILGEPLHLEVSTSEWIRILVSAIIGITLGDTFYVAAINRLGASFQAIVDGLYAPFVILLSLFFFSETISAQAYLGGAMIIFAIFLAHLNMHRLNISRANLLSGIGYAVLSQFAMASCVVMVKDLLSTQPLIALTLHRFLYGTIILLAFQFWKNRKLSLAEYLPRKGWRVLVPGTVLGPYLATLFWFAGFKYTLAGKAAIYNQLSTILIVVLAALFLNEKLTWNRVLAIGLAVAGGLVVFAG